MEFKQFRDLLQANFEELKNLPAFAANTDKDVLWDLYLDSFPEGTNKMHLERREFDCNCCKSFIRQAGSILFIDGLEIKTIWGFKTGSAVYQPVVDVLDQYVKSCGIKDVYLTYLPEMGTFKSGDWYHFFLKTPSSMFLRGGSDIPSAKANFRDSRNVFKRSLDELTEESVLTVLELISQGSLYRGDEWKAALNIFLGYLREYHQLSPSQREIYAWTKSMTAGGAISRIRNHSIGTLLIDISEGVDLDVAVRKYEAIIAPENYKRPKAIFTAKMLEDAKKTIQSLGYMESLPRRYASLSDITVNNILFSNKDSAKVITGDVFANMASDLPQDPKKFSRVEEVTIENFVSNILPHAKEIEALVEGKTAQSFVSLIAPVNKQAPSMFKWANAYSWAYTGNIADSLIRERVKEAGGKVDGVLRFSIQWNDGDGDQSDYDAHCFVPNGSHISFRDKRDYKSEGRLDVDIVVPSADRPAVENITWPNLQLMPDGTYRFYVNCFSNRGSSKSFKAEIEANGTVHSYEYNRPMKTGESVDIAEVVLKNGEFTIKDTLDSQVSSREIWGVKTNQFTPVSLVMYSPNYWDEQNGNGNRHYMFMLKGCKNEESPNGFYNEFLKNELLEHKRVFEALGGKMQVQPSDDQLSGIGFSSTKRDSLIVRVTGQTKRIIKINF